MKKTLNDDRKDDPFKDVLNIISQQLPNSFEKNHDNNEIVELCNLFDIQLNLLGDTIYRNNIENPISDAPNNYADFKRDIDKVSKTFSLNPAYDFLECYINDDFLFQNENINDYSFLQDSPFNIKQNDNNKNNIIFLDEGSPLFDEEEKNRYRKCDDIFENGNNSFQGKNKCVNPRKNTFVNSETKECSNCIPTTQKSSKKLNLAEKKESSFHHAENNESNQEKEKINNYGGSEKKIGNNSDEIKNTIISNEKESGAHGKEIFDEKNNHCSVGCKDKKEQKSPHISKNTSSLTNIPTLIKPVELPITNLSKKISFSLPTENVILSINLINMIFSDFNLENNSINNQFKQNRPLDKIIGKKLKREKYEITDNEEENKANINNFWNKRDIVMREINKNEEIERLFECSRSGIPVYRNYLEEEKKVEEISAGIEKMKLCSEDEIKNIYSNNLNDDQKLEEEDNNKKVSFEELRKRKNLDRLFSNKYESSKLNF